MKGIGGMPFPASALGAVWPNTAIFIEAERSAGHRPKSFHFQEKALANFFNGFNYVCICILVYIYIQEKTGGG
jgi:hypothetical protein